MQAISESIYSVYYILRFNRPINWFELGPLILSKFQTCIPFPPVKTNILPGSLYSDSKNTPLFLISFTNHNINPEKNMPEDLKEAYDEWVPYNQDHMIDSWRDFLNIHDTLIEHSLLQKEEKKFDCEMLELFKYKMYLESIKMDKKINESNVFSLSEEEKEIKAFVEEWTKSQTDLTIVYNGWMEYHRIHNYDTFEEMTEEQQIKIDLNKDKFYNIIDMFNKLEKENELNELEKIEEELRIKKEELRINKESI